VALSVGLGRGIAAAPDAADRVTGDWGALFDSGIVVAAVLAVVLNVVLPGVRAAPRSRRRGPRWSWRTSSPSGARR
jgi:NCS2 family nucleobase:cation symporter-2